MKKILSFSLTAVMAMGMAFIMTGCGGGEPYEKYDLTEYITLPDYNSYEVTEPEVVISDEDVEEGIQAKLDAAATTEDVTEGTVQEGDKVKISFEGTLADGSTVDGMSSDSYSLTLGSGNMIDGFEEGLYGAAIGKEVTLDLQFPDPYSNNEELSGKDVTFKVTVLSKEVKTVPELNEDFVKENSDCETIEEYRKMVAEELEQQEYDSQLSTIKEELYMKLVDETEVKKYPEKEVDEYFKELDEYYRYGAESTGYEWEDFLEAQSMTQDEYEDQIQLYAEEYVKQEMVIYLFAQKEGIEISDEEYEEFLADNLKSAGFESEDDFKDYTGMTLDEYAEQARLKRNMLLTKELDMLYDRLLDGDAASSDDADDGSADDSAGSDSADSADGGSADAAGDN
ncbi:MAG: trigger factor [Anaerovoracaceae bacterium]